MTGHLPEAGEENERMRRAWFMIDDVAADAWPARGLKDLAGPGRPV
jgi:hypothetical protein